MRRKRPSQNYPTLSTVELPAFDEVSAIDVDSLQRTVRRLQRLYDSVLQLGRIFSSTRDPNLILKELLTHITALLNARRSSLFLVDHKKGVLIPKILQGVSEPVDITIPIGQGIAGWTAKTGEIINIEDAYSDPRFNPEFDKKFNFRTYSLLSLPLLNQNGDIIGVIQVLNKRDAEKFSQTDVLLLEALAAQASIFLENAQLYQDLLQKRRELEIVFELEQQINQSLALDEILSNIVKKVVTLLDCEAAGLAVVREKKHRLFIYSLSESSDKAFTLDTEIKPNQGFMSWALYYGQELICNDPENDNRVCEIVNQNVDFPIHSLLCIPIKNSERILGAIELFNKNGGFSEDDLRLVRQIASQIHRAIEIGERRAKEINENRLAAIGQLLSSILHDLKGPMTTISGYAQMLIGQNDQEKRRRYANSILKQIERIHQMTWEVLAFAKGETSILIRKVNMEKFLEEVRESLSQIFRNTQISLEIENRGVTFANFDKIKMHRLFSNLARNAKQAMGKSGTFKITIQEEEPDHIGFFFSDTGHGIPEAIRDRIFESFVTSRPEDGSGLGLAIVKKIVNDHGGEISFWSQEGHGTTFIIRIPKNPPRLETKPPNDE